MSVTRVDADRRGMARDRNDATRSEHSLALYTGLEWVGLRFETTCSGAATLDLIARKSTIVPYTSKPV